jgi:flavodoxin
MSTTPTPTTAAGSNVLLVYFSRPGENYWEGGRRDLEVGNTKVLAQIIAERVECDEHEIQAADPYPEAYDPTVERNRQEQADDARPAIAGDLPDLNGYDIVLLGCPVWNSSAPMIMHTLLESIDLAGTTVLPFVTYAISGMSGVDTEFREALPDAEVRDGLAVRGEDAADAAAAVEQWLGTNGLG